VEVTTPSENGDGDILLIALIGMGALLLVAGAVIAVVLVKLNEAKKKAASAVVTTVPSDVFVEEVIQTTVVIDENDIPLSTENSAENAQNSDDKNIGE
jgi:hypothetical protein